MNEKQRSMAVCFNKFVRTLLNSYCHALSPNTTFRYIHIYAVCTMIKIVKRNSDINEDSNNSNNNEKILQKCIIT